jgi:hypothetical protein
MTRSLSVPIPCSGFVSISGCLDLAVVWHQWIDPRRALHQSPAGAAPGRLRRRIDSFLVKGSGFDRSNSKRDFSGTQIWRRHSRQRRGVNLLSPGRLKERRMSGWPKVPAPSNLDCNALDFKGSLEWANQFGTSVDLRLPGNKFAKSLQTCNNLHLISPGRYE